MLVSNPKEIILQWRDFYQMKKVENKVLLLVLCFGFLGFVCWLGFFKQNTDTHAE